MAHKQVIVFNTGGPIRCEAILPSNTHGAAPAGRACRGQFSAENVLEDAKAVARHRRAALKVKQRGVPCIADLAGKEADAIGFGARGEQRIDEADALAAEVRPIALSFQAKHPLVGLPAIADLAADEAPGPFAAAVSDDYAKRINKIHTIATLTPTAVGANVEAGPIVDRGNHRRGSLGVRTCSQISCRRGSGYPQCNQTNGPHQKLPHHSIPIYHALR